MKKYLLICIIITLSPIYNFGEEYAEWLHPSFGLDLEDVIFTSDADGWIVGNPGYLLHTTDGGDNWEFIETDVTGRLNAIIEHEGSLIAVGDEGIILRSYDNGATWQLTQVENADWAYFGAICFRNSENGFILGKSGDNYSSKMWVSTDGGATWVEQPEVYPYLSSITFSTQTVGWAAGYGSNGTGVIYKTTDGGETWNQIMQSDALLYTINFNDQLHGWISGEGKLLYTTNGGIDWQESETNFYNVDVYDFLFTDTLNGWCVARNGSIYLTYWWGEIYHTTDGGLNWELVYQGEPSLTYSFYSITGIGSQLWVCGSGTILHSDHIGDEWQHQSQNISKAMLSSLSVVENNIWTYGRVRGSDEQMLFFSDNAGNNWTLIDPDSIGIIDLFTLDFVSEQIGWIAGEGNIIKTTNGGDIWIPLLNNDPNKYYSYVDFVDSLNGWCQLYDLEEHEEDERFILHTTDGGCTWEIQTTVPRTGSLTTSPNNLRALNPSVCWYCGLGGSVWRTIDGGETWEEVTSVPTYYTAACVEPISETEAWIGTSNQRIHHTIDGGETWETTYLLTGSYGTIYDIRFQGDIGFALSWESSGVFHSHLFRTIDGGESWIEMQPPMTEEMNNMVIDDNDLVINGDHSVVVRYNDIVSTGVYDEPEIINAPQTPLLMQNYPNPFNPSTTIAYQVPVGTYNYTSLRIYDTMGRLVKSLVDEKQEAGYHTVQWHGRDDNGRQVPSGIYVYRLETTDGYEETRKMILLK